MNHIRQLLITKRQLAGNSPDQDAQKKPKAISTDVRTVDNSQIEKENTGSESHQGPPEGQTMSETKPMAFAAVTSMLCLVVLLVALDNTILATAIPRIVDQFRTLNDVGWYASAYMLTNCAFQLSFGRLYSTFSIKSVLLAGIFIFEVGSAVCGSATSSNALIAGRAVSGLGAAGVFQGAFVTIANTVPVVKRPVYNGIFGGMYGVASIIGPLLGGALTEHANWRWCFYINLPIGAAAFVIIWATLKLPNSEHPLNKPQFRQILMRLDPLGTAVFLPGVICLLLALVWGGVEYPWSSGRIVALLTIFAVSMFVFAYIEHRTKDNAMLPISLLRQLSVSFGALYMLLFSSSYFVIVYYTPLFFQVVKDASPTDSGLMCLPSMISMVLLSFLTGGIITKSGLYTPFLYVGAGLLTLGSGLITTWNTTTGSPKWIGYQVIFGAGAGIGVQLPVVIIQLLLQSHLIPTGTAIMIFAQTLGGAVFVAVGQTLLINKLSTGLNAVLPGGDAVSINSIGSVDILASVPSSYIADVKNVYSNALTTSWYISVALGAAAVVVALGVPHRRFKTERNAEGPGGETSEKD